MAKRGLKSRYPIGSALENRLYVGLELLQRRSYPKIDKSKFLDEAINDLLNKYKLVVDPQDPEVQEILNELGITLGDSTKK